MDAKTTHDADCCGPYIQLNEIRDEIIHVQSSSIFPRNSRIRGEKTTILS